MGETALATIGEALDTRHGRGERMIVTLVHPGGTARFGGDNWSSMRTLFGEAGDALGRRDAVVVVRRFEPWDGPAVPERPKSVWSFRVSEGRILGLSAQDQTLSSCTDATTGGRLPPEPGVTYVDALEAMPEVGADRARFSDGGMGVPGRPRGGFAKRHPGRRR